MDESVLYFFKPMLESGHCDGGGVHNTKPRPRQIDKPVEIALRVNVNQTIGMIGSSSCRTAISNNVESQRWGSPWSLIGLQQ